MVALVETEEEEDDDVPLMRLFSYFPTLESLLFVLTLVLIFL